MARRSPEIETLDELRRRLDAGARDLSGWHLQSLDLSDVDLTGLDVTGTVVLGGALAPGQELDLRSRGALVFPALPDLPFDPYRAHLYSPAELYAGLDAGYEATYDARVYAWTRGEHGLDRTLAAALHDHSIGDALTAWVAGRSLAGVMGGHALERGTEAYAATARLGALLARRHTVATGGGPGAMEAANLGARLSADGDLEAALATVAAVPSFRPDLDAWARTALAAVADRPGTDTLGVPTWFYGHEPPNLFASHVAKYVGNAVREDVLLTVCRAGIVFLPGAAGTVQEVFQDACENYYADPAGRAPMVLVGEEHWTRTLPVWPLLRALLHDHEAVHLVDDVEAAAEILT